MNPLFYVIKIAGITALTSVGAFILLRKAVNNQTDLALSAIHFRKGIKEIGQGFSTMFFGKEDKTDEALSHEQKASKRIVIE
ncbi:MAG: hypothetical protein AB7V04_09965 [Desulfomonilaceae bacterium]